MVWWRKMKTSGVLDTDLTEASEGNYTQDGIISPQKIEIERGKQNNSTRCCSG